MDNQMFTSLCGVCFAAGNVLECQPAYPSQEVERALDSTATTVEDMGVDHGRLHALVPEQLLDRPEVIPVHEHVCREGAYAV
jgi:hypothetical protein